MKTLIETWEINARLNLYLLEAISPELHSVKLEKGKTVLGNFTHIHNVRLMWIKSAGPEHLEGLEKLDEKVETSILIDQLSRSTLAMSAILESAGTPEGKIKGFKPHASAFVGYLVAHETFHRTCIELALRQNGTPLADKVAYGLWEWGVR